MKESFFRLVILEALGALFFVPVGHAEDPPQFVLQWGTSGADTSQFDGPSGIATDSAGNVYVADTGNNRIQKFSSTGEFIAMWGSTGSASGQFVKPFGIAIDASDNVYVVEQGLASPSDNANNRVQKFTSNGGYITMWGHRGTDPELFIAPHGVATDASGYVYVADWGNSRIKKFTSGGTYVDQWGESFYQPHGVASDDSNHVFVAFYTNSLVQKVTPSGGLITTWGGGLGDGEYQFHYVPAVATDATGNVYVVDVLNRHIKKYDNNGVYLSQWGEQEDGGNGNFGVPMAIAVDTGGNIYVADYENRIQKFSYVTTGIGDVPTRSALVLRVYPNPFNPASTIRFTVPETAPVTLVVYDATGKVVATLIDRTVMTVGPHEAEFRHSGASGVYFTKLTVGGQSQTVKLVELK